MKIVCCVFTGYHAVKNKVRSQQIIIEDQDHYGGTCLRTLWTNFAEAASAEAAELSVSFRRFSVPKFMNFLSQGSPLHYNSLSLSLCSHSLAESKELRLRRHAGVPQQRPMALQVRRQPRSWVLNDELDIVNCRMSENKFIK